MTSTKALEAGTAVGRRRRGDGSIVLRETRKPASRAGEVAIPVDSEAFRALAAQPEIVRKLVEAFGRIVAGAAERSPSAPLAVTIDFGGKSEIVDFAADAATPDEADRDAAFAAARARGRIRAAEVLGRSDMLSADQMAERLGISRMTVNARRQRHELLGLDGAKRGFRFPEWQVDEDGRPIASMPRLFELLGPSPWGVYRFLTQRHDALGGATGMDALRRGQTDKVLDAAESLARGDFS